MSNSFTVDILTPSKIVAKGIPAESLFVPTIRGQINVLADHTHLVTKLDTGILSVFGGSGDPDRYFALTTGVCKILDGKVVILSEACEEAKDIDVELAREAAENAQQMLKKDNLSDEEIDGYRRKLNWAQLRVQLAGEYGDKR